MRSSLFSVFILTVVLCSAMAVSGQQRKDVITPDPFTKVLSFVQSKISAESIIRTSGKTQTYTISGRAVTANGRPVYNACIQLTDFNGFNRSANTSPLGFFTITEIPSGDIYALSVSHKHFLFSAPTQLIEIKADMTDILMLAELP